MAHIKVVRRSMRPEEWTDLRFGWLKRHIYSSKWEIKNLMIRDARQVSEMEFEYYSEDYRPLNKGDMYFTPDGTAFIKADVDIPEELQGKELWFSLKTAAEICVKVNDRYIGGVDPNRERMLLSPYVNSKETLHFDMMGYNRSKPDDERNPESLSVRGCRQIFEGAYICTVNHPVQNLVWDFELLLDIAKSELFSEDYRNFLNKELNNAMNFIDFDSDELSGVEEAQKYLDEVVFANDTYKGSGDVALIAHSHLDIAYYWRRIHAVQKNLRTVLIQLRLMDKYPDFKYTHTQPYVYETLEKYYPDVFEELKEKVANGQFEPVGAMYVEPDCNIPSAESLIRQCLYGQQTYERMFGKRVNNAWLPDVFGNSWILPQILKKSGVDYFVSNKMSTWNDTNRFPHNNFIWKGIDGTDVLACVPPTHFITWNMPSQIQENWEAYIDKDSGGQTMNTVCYTHL
ncbi:MAG: alpha-mannosidase, partial [Eubacterium sp.]|nr:alpha-mannosidase [Eubacterium sp.]